MRLLFFIFLLMFLIGCNSNKQQSYKKEIEKLNNIYLTSNILQFNAHNYEYAIREIDSIYKANTRYGLTNSIVYYYTLNWMNNNIGKYNRTIETGNKLIDLIESNSLQNDFYKEYISGLTETGSAYFSINNFEKAYQNYFKAQNISLNKKDNCQSALITSSIGLISYQQKLFYDAIKYFHQEISFINNCEDKYYRGGKMKQEALDNIGLAYTNLNKLDSAKIYYDLALQQIEVDYKNDTSKANATHEYEIRRGIVLGNLAKVYVKRNELDSAEMLYKQAIELNTKPKGFINDAQLCQVQLAPILLSKQKFEACKTLLHLIKISLDTLQNSSAYQAWLEQMSYYNKAIGNYKLETNYFKQFIAFRDSINDAKKGSSEISITKQLKEKQQELEITVLQKDNQLSKSYLLIVAVACVLFILIAAIIYKNFKKSKLLNATINKQKEDLQKANKDKDRILNVVAHDLRNPIGAIANFLNIALIKYEHSDDEDKILQTSQQASENALILINDLLEVNQMQDGNIELNITQVDINKLIETSIDYLKYKAKVKEQIIVFEKTNNNYFIKIDAEKLQRVLINLIDNAIKFSHLKKEISITVKEQNKHLILSVQDTGVGMPKHIIEQLFTASITVKRTGTNNEKSHGLGLTICKQIIEAHKGTLSVVSEEGKGSCFVIALPI